jgi:tetratricopeptide (TPR) repeat protein
VSLTALAVAGLLAASAPPAPTPSRQTLDADRIERAWEARRSGDLATARRLYEEALASRPNDARAAVGLAETLTDMGDAAGAIRILTRVVQALPAKPVPHRALARAYLSAGQFREAAVEAARAIELSPRDAEAHVLAGRAAVGAGEAAAAVPSFERALEIQPGEPRALAGLAAAYAALSDPRADAMYAKAIAADPHRLPLRVE